MRIRRKLIRPILQDPSTRMTISAMADDVQTNWSTGLWAMNREKETEKKMNLAAHIQSHVPIDTKTLSSEETDKPSTISQFTQQSVNAGTVILSHFVIAQSIIRGQGRTCLIYEHSSSNQPKQNYFAHTILTEQLWDSHWLKTTDGILNSNKSCVCLCHCECDGNSWQSHCAITTYPHTEGVKWWSVSTGSKSEDHRAQRCLMGVCFVPPSIIYFHRNTGRQRLIAWCKSCL